MSRAHLLQGEEQEAAQKAQVRPHLPTFDEAGRQYVLAYRTQRTVVFLQSNFSHEHHDNLFYAWSLATVHGEEIRDGLIGRSASLNDMITAANRWELQN